MLRDLHSFPTRRSSDLKSMTFSLRGIMRTLKILPVALTLVLGAIPLPAAGQRSEEHTSELQSRGHLVCRLLLEKKNSGTMSDRRTRRQGGQGLCTTSRT